MNIYELKDALDKLNTQAHDIFKKTGYETFGELSSIEFDPKPLLYKGGLGTVQNRTPHGIRSICIEVRPY